MHLLILMLVLAVGVCEEVYWQKLTCPYEPKHQNLLRIWCRQSSADCCTGFTFSHSSHLVDGGKLKVTQNSDSFTVAVLEASHEEGVYWCGVLSKNDTIIKLAAGYVHSSSGAYVWSFARWCLIPLLPLVIIFTSTYARVTRKHHFKKAEEPNAAASRALDDPQYENAAPLYELE